MRWCEIISAVLVSAAALARHQHIHAFQHTTSSSLSRRPAAVVGASRLTTSSRLHSKFALPKFDKATERWVSTSQEEEEGYGPFGTLLRFGPVPFIKRLTDPDKVEQAVLKYQAQEKCSRVEAQANMDAYFENSRDWIQQKLEEKRGLPKRNYAYLDTTKIVLSLAWAILVTSVLGTMANEVISGNYCINYPDARFCEVFPR